MFISTCTCPAQQTRHGKTHPLPSCGERWEGTPPAQPATGQHSHLSVPSTGREVSLLLETCTDLQIPAQTPFSASKACPQGLLPTLCQSLGCLGKVPHTNQTAVAWCSRQPNSLKLNYRKTLDSLSVLQTIIQNQTSVSVAQQKQAVGTGRVTHRANCFFIKVFLINWWI